VHIVAAKHAFVVEPHAVRLLGENPLPQPLSAVRVPSLLASLAHLPSASISNPASSVPNTDGQLHSRLAPQIRQRQ
jgi:hypothetical protein